MKKKLVQAILLFIIAGISLTSGIILIPNITDYGEFILAFIISALILVYVYYYLLLKIVKTSRGSVLILTLIEMILLTIIAISSIIGKFASLPYLDDSNKIIGLVFWLIGLIESLRSYYYNESYNHSYPIYKLIVNLTFITLGTWFFVTSYEFNIVLIWAISILLFILSIALIIKGILKIKNSPVQKEIPFEILNS